MWIPESAALIRGRGLFVAQRLLEEIRYLHLIYKNDNQISYKLENVSESL